MKMQRLINIFTKEKSVAILIGLFYFIALLITMPDYNLVWDARNHYFKGQDFANFFLTGRKNYDGLPITKDYARYYRDYISKYAPDPNINKRISPDPNYRRSIYQDDFHNFEWLMKSNQIEHPVFGDIAAAFSNIVFYEKLGLLRDDYAYRPYTIFLASILVGLIFYWMLISYGLFPAIVSTLSIGLMPLFWAESHFNLKDVPQMTFFTLAIWEFWRGIILKSKKRIIFSSFFAGCAFATKLNIVFLPFILIPWFFIFYIKSRKKDRNLYNHWIWLLIIYPIIMIGIIFLIWPQFWQKPIESFMAMLKTYYEVGIYPDYTPAFRTIFNFSIYAFTWIILTTYPLIGVLTFIGIFFTLFNLKKNKDFLPLLFLLWLFIPILRASLPFTSIFGGVRHIMEYIPPFSMLTGYGVYKLFHLVPSRYKLFIRIGIILGFIPLLMTLIRLHPAENVYFNSLIGGLAGAKKANITGWGYNDGGIYRKATDWLNKNAKKNTHIVTAFSEPADFYIPELREDLLADNYFSGYLQKGEYIIALTHDSELQHTYRMSYPENLLEPVYVYSVDGVPLIKIWKNDKEHLKKEIKFAKEILLNSIVEVKNNGLYWDLGKSYRIIQVEVNFDKFSKCKLMANSNIQISDDEESWEILAEGYPGEVIEALGIQPKNNKLLMPIAGLEARYISLIPQESNGCIPDPQKTIVRVIQDN